MWTDVFVFLPLKMGKECHDMATFIISNKQILESVRVENKKLQKNVNFVYYLQNVALHITF